MMDQTPTGTDLTRSRNAEVDSIPGKLRSLACVHRVINVQLGHELALRLARRIEDGSRLTVENANLRAQLVELTEMADRLVESRAALRDATDAAEAAFNKLPKLLLCIGLEVFALGALIATIIRSYF